MSMANAVTEKPEELEVVEVIHEVVKGDTLPDIAEKNDVPLETLMEDNGIENPHILWIGQKIKIRGAKKKAAPKKPKAKKAE